VCDLNRIELLAETLRAALKAVAVVALTGANRNYARVAGVRGTGEARLEDEL